MANDICIIVETASINNQRDREDENSSSLLHTNIDCIIDRNSDPPPLYSQIPGVVPLSTGGCIGPPPTYNEVIDPNVSPPSYQSLFGQVREARKSATGFIDLVQKLALVVLGALGMVIIISFHAFIPIASVVIGINHFNECPAENLPTFLIIGGLVWIFRNVIVIHSLCKINSQNSSTFDIDFTSFIHKRDAMLTFFLSSWYCAGCILVYRIYRPNFTDPTNRRYCNKTVYLYALWLVTIALFIFCYQLFQFFYTSFTKTVTTRRRPLY